MKNMIQRLNDCIRYHQYMFTIIYIYQIIKIITRNLNVKITKTDEISELVKYSYWNIWMKHFHIYFTVLEFFIPT